MSLACDQGWSWFLSDIDSAILWFCEVQCKLILTPCFLHCVSKNDHDVARYNFDADQPIFIIFGRDVTERECYQMVICYPTSPN